MIIIARVMYIIIKNYFQLQNYFQTILSFSKRAVLYILVEVEKSETRWRTVVSTTKLIP